MKTTITKKLLGLALSVFSIVAMAQCPTVTNLNVTLGANGTATLSPTMTGTVSPTLTNYFWLATQNNGIITTSYQFQAQLQFPANGNYLVCFELQDSLNGCASNQFCDSITISNMLPTTCNAGFTAYTDSNCVTHFINSSTGNNLTYQWYDINNGFILLSTAQNPTLNLANGGNQIALYTYSSGQFCDTMTQYINVNCSNNPANTCNASFIAHTDSNCVTHFLNTPSTNGYSIWYVDGMTYSYTPSVNLTNGMHSVTQVMYDQTGFVCDTAYQNISIYCPNSSTVTPTCNAGFVYYTDSSCVTYFYNTSVTNNGYVIWNVDGVTYSVTPTVNLTNGNHNVYQTVYDQTGNICDTAYQSIYVNCQNNGTVTPAGCQVNSQFYVFADSTNAGNYFAYNFSSGNGVLSYLWNFGDGTTSTQQYPFHQYAAPGQYVICLTVTSTSGTTTCTDSYCDSSSVQRMAAGFQMSQVNVIPLAVTGIKQAELLTQLNAYPNPIADELTIEATTKDGSKLNYSLIDALGRVILQGNIENSKAIINTSSLEKGFYSLSIINEKGSSLKAIKLVK